MRIGVDYRFLSAGLSTVNRGMGRYTQQQIREVLNLDNENEYVLFCPPNFDRALILPEIRRSRNVSTATVQRSDQWLQSDPNHPGSVLQFVEEYQEWVYRQQIDLYHATTPFLFNDTIAACFDVCPMVTTFYDAIPLIFREHYFPRHAPITDLYLRATQFIRSARRLVAISESARRDAIYYSGFPASQIDVAYPVADPWFHPLPVDQVERDLHSLRQRMRLPDIFTMAVPHLHYSKNFETLLDSYALLPPSLRQVLPLVVTCYFQDAEKELVRKLLEKRGLTDDVLITGFVTEDELVALYNRTLLFLHVSRYEGFGLPVLEAMCCGAPIIAANTSALPEVGGEAALWVDPNNPRSIADAILTMYDDSDKRKAMRERGLSQATQFTPAQLGQHTLACYQRALTPPTPEVDARPRLALWTPLPPLRSGVADYSMELLEYLTMLYDVEVFVDGGYLPDLPTLRRCDVHHHSAFVRRQTQRPFDLIIYQMGASMFHAYMYEALQRCPGLVVLHDLVWGYVLYEWFASRGRSGDFRNELAMLEGPSAVEEFDQALRQLSENREALFDFLDHHYMLTRIVTRSRAVLVHMEEVEHELKERYQTEAVYHIRMGVADPQRVLPEGGVEQLRTELDLPLQAFVVGVFGIVHPVKRFEVVFAAFQQLSALHPNALLVIVGDTSDVRYKTLLAEHAERLQIAERVRCTGYLPPQAFDRWLMACDVVVNLRYPSRKQMSAILLRAIAAGKPVILSDLPEWQFIPGEFSWRVAVNHLEANTLAHHLEQLASDLLLRSQTGRYARSYFLRQANVLSMIMDYQRVIKALLNRAAESAPRDLPTPLAFLNKIGEVEDWTVPELNDLRQEIFTSELPIFEGYASLSMIDRRHWEGAIIALALRRGAALHQTAKVLGVGDGILPLLNYLAHHVEQVFTVGDYLGGDVMKLTVLTAPRQLLPFDDALQRVIVQHMDPRSLRFPDNYFDGAFVCALTMHVDGLEALAQIAYEAGRTLKPGGVFSITLNYLLSGPPGGTGWDPERPLLSWPDIQYYVVEASGLELSGPIHLSPSAATLAQDRDRAVEAGEADSPIFHSHLIRTVEGYVFCPLHLSLSKSQHYPLTPNSWAKPADDVRLSIHHAALQTAQVVFHANAGSSTGISGVDLRTWSQFRPSEPAPAFDPAPSRRSLNMMRGLLSEDRLVRIRWQYGQALRWLPRWVAQQIHQWAFRLGLVETKEP